MRFCGYCNRSLPAESSFCPYCGERQRSTLKCLRCDGGNAWNARFCGTCGNPITNGNSSPELENVYNPTLLDPRKENKVYLDDTILDVTNNPYIIPQPDREVRLKESELRVPPWPHQYIYSASEIQNATRDQTAFYQFFKSSFLRGELLDVEGNSNYAFILLFDLVDSYDVYGNIAKLEENLQQLGHICPKTTSYGRNLLANRMESNNDTDGLRRLRNYPPIYDYWAFGNKYKQRLNLTFDETALLNRVYSPASNFASVEFCRIEIIKLYLASIRVLTAEYLKLGTTLDAEFEKLADVISHRDIANRSYTDFYDHNFQTVLSGIYSLIFKICENAVREQYTYKRKINIEPYRSQAVKAEVEERLVSKLRTIIETEAAKIKPPDEPTEIELNAQLTTRWKSKFQSLTAGHNIEGKRFIDELLLLGNMNRRNPSVENIFYEGSKFISKIDKEAALKLYIHYLFYDLKSAKLDNKKLIKTIQNSLFNTKEQLHEFEKIIGEFINDRDLTKALAAVSEIYVTKRKEIKLNRVAIEKVVNEHSGTVELLNEYLQDEFEDERIAIVSTTINNDEIQIEITQKAAIELVTESAPAVELSGIQMELLRLIAKNNFIIAQDDVENLAKARGLFRNQLIDSINEVCFESIDDVLIEEDEEYYVISEDYYQKIMKI